MIDHYGCEVLFFFLLDMAVKFINSLEYQVIFCLKKGIVKEYFSPELFCLYYHCLLLVPINLEPKADQDINPKRINK